MSNVFFQLNQTIGLNWRHMLYKLTTSGQLEINRWPWSSSHRTGVISTEKLNKLAPTDTILGGMRITLHNLGGPD